MTIVLKAASTTLAAVAVMGIGIGVASAATPNGSTAGHSVNPASAQWSRHFDYYNTSSIPMILTNQSWPTGTPNGTVVLPGQQLGFEVPYDGGMMENSYLEFTPKAGFGATGKVQYTLEIEGVANTTSWASLTDGTSGFTALTDDRKLYSLDPDGTDITLDGKTNAAAQRIATALHQLCDADSTLTSCQFDVTSEDRNAWGPVHQVGPSERNRQDHQITYKQTEADAVSVTDNVGVNVSVGGQLFGIINTSVNVSYQHAVSSGSTFTYGADIPVNPGDTVWVLDTAPVIRDTGDFTITMGNSTYHLDNVSFDSADPSRQGQWQSCSLTSPDKCPIGPDGSPNDL